MLRITLARPAGDLLARLAMPMFCVVPLDTPAPTEVASRSRRRGHTTSAPDGRSDGPRPQPELPREAAGRPGAHHLPDRCATARAVALAQGGDVDVVTWDYDPISPLAPGGALDRRYGNDHGSERDGSPRYHVAPAPGVDMLAFNTRRPLFSDRACAAPSTTRSTAGAGGVFDEAPTDRYVPRPCRRADPAGVSADRPDLAARSSWRRPAPAEGERLRLRGAGEPADRADRPRGPSAAGHRRLDHADVGCLRGPDPKAARADIVLITRAPRSSIRSRSWRPWWADLPFGRRTGR